MSTLQYTIVRHSAYYTSHADFTNAVESRAIRKVADKRAVTAAGGVLFDDYNQAERFAEKENYPPSVMGLIPRVPGTFAKTRVEGQEIYIPTPTN